MALMWRISSQNIAELELHILDISSPNDETYNPMLLHWTFYIFSHAAIHLMAGNLILFCNHWDLIICNFGSSFIENYWSFVILSHKGLVAPLRLVHGDLVHLVHLIHGDLQVELDQIYEMCEHKTDFVFLEMIDIFTNKMSKIFSPKLKNNSRGV